MNIVGNDVVEMYLLKYGGKDGLGSSERRVSRRRGWGTA